MVEIKRVGVGILISIILSLLSIGSVSAATNFNCNGEVEAKIWSTWNGSVRKIVKNDLIEARLLRQHDTYALYDLEVVLHNLLDMSRRCNRYEFQSELAALLSETFAAQERYSSIDSRAAWICRGGAICNKGNGLFGTEVMLSSVQFLALLTDLANSLADQPDLGENSLFIDRTMRTAIDHLQRWDTPAIRAALQKQLDSKPDDVVDTSSSLLLSDKTLWQISIYANVAGVMVRFPERWKAWGMNAQTAAKMSGGVFQMLRLLNARISLTSRKEGRGAKKVADLDAGYWRFYPDNRYAAYSGSAKPVSCSTDEARTRLDVNVASDGVEVLKDLGWDISHARRLVHLFNSLEKNNRALASSFGIPMSVIPTQDVMQAFATQLRLVVWNQNSQMPLFTNFFNGANGWYRVAYNNGTGKCSEGIPPFGLSESFATGGYIQWGIFDPKLRMIGARLYQLAQSEGGKEGEFMARFYPSIRENSGGNTDDLGRIQFLPTLIFESK